MMSHGDYIILFTVYVILYTDNLKMIPLFKKYFNKFPSIIYSNKYMFVILPGYYKTK